MAEHLFDCISLALLLTAIDVHTNYVRALRGNYADTKLRTARKEVSVAHSFRNHFREMASKHRRDNNHRAGVGWGLRDTPGRFRPYHYSHHLDETMAATVDPPGDSLYESPLPPWMVRPWG
jgi:hypothetical protein